MVLAKYNQASVTHAAISEPLVCQLQTTQMLKMLTKILPGYEWKSSWLRDNVKTNGSYSFEMGITLSYIGQPGGAGHEYLWEIKVDPSLAEELSRAYREITAMVIGQGRLKESEKTAKALPGKVEDSACPKPDGTYRWNNLPFRSPAEIAVAKALESRGILFFPNAKCRIRNRIGITETKETDFLVFYKGTPRILEVDGREYHQQPAEDYRRDRMFDRYGIRSTRFTASECLNNADGVVEEFLELFCSDCLNF